jgi:hypothetical protein
MRKAMQTLQAFIDEWTDTEEKTKAAFVQLKNFLERKAGVNLDFIPRPGVTYSLRAAHENQQSRQLFVMVDVIEDQPRWLSVCFYGEMIEDPAEQGDYVPGGLLGEDAICFDIEAFDADQLKYIEARLDEACASGSKGD